jgi:hypothetical protein
LLGVEESADDVRDASAVHRIQEASTIHTISESTTSGMKPRLSVLRVFSISRVPIGDCLASSCVR